MQQISRYHAQNMSNIVTLRLQHQVTNKTTQIPLRVGGMEQIHGNMIEGCAVHKRPVGRRWSSTIGCDNSRFRGIPEHLDKDEKRKEQSNIFMEAAEPLGGKPQNWQNTHNGDYILDTSFR